MTRQKNPSWNIADNEARIIITTNCNYKCVFCHSEGFDPYSKCPWKPDWLVLQRIIDDLMAEGCEDITITGGEPLLYKQILMKAARHIALKNDQASLTIVTNGALFEEAWLKEIMACCGNLRFNISLHTADPKRYAEITDQNQTSLGELRANLLLLKQLNIPFKLNCVTLRETMRDKSILAILDFSKEVGARAVKFIELLIMEQNDSMFSSYISNDTLAKMLPSSFSLSKRTKRRDEYTSSVFPFTVELQKCRCRFGCNNCLTENTTCITGDGMFHPCFEYSGKSFDITQMSLPDTLSKGMTVIEELARKFGDGSPSLIKDIQFTDRHKSVYFKQLSPELPDEIKRNCVMTQKREYSDYYFTSELSSDPSKTVKMRVHHADKQNAKLIISTVIAERVGDLFVSSRIFQNRNKVPMIDEPDFIVNTMKQLGWTIAGKLKFFEHEYLFGKTQFRTLNLNGDINLIDVQLSSNSNSENINHFLKEQYFSMIEESIDLFFRRQLK